MDTVVFDGGIGAGTHVSILEDGSLEAWNSFENRGVIHVGTSDGQFASLNLTDLGVCAGGEIHLLSETSRLDWIHEGPKRFTGDTRITFAGASSALSSTGAGNLTFEQESILDFTASDRLDPGQMLVTEDGVVLDGLLRAIGRGQNVAVTVGFESLFNIRRGQVIIDQSASLWVNNLVARPGAQVTVTNGAELFLDGNWSGGNGIEVNDASVNLGGEFTNEDLLAINRMNAVTTITGRMDLQGTTLSSDETWRLSGGTLANGIIPASADVVINQVAGLDRITVQNEISSAGGLLRVTDLRLDGKLSLRNAGFVPARVEVEGNIRGDGEIMFSVAGLIPFGGIFEPAGVTPYEIAPTIKITNPDAGMIETGN